MVNKKGKRTGGLNAGLCKVTIFCVIFFVVTQSIAAPPLLHADGNKIKDPNGDIVILRGVSMIDMGNNCKVPNILHLYEIVLKSRSKWISVPAI